MSPSEVKAAVDAYNSGVEWLDTHTYAMTAAHTSTLLALGAQFVGALAAIGDPFAVAAEATCWRAYAASADALIAEMRLVDKLEALNEPSVWSDSDATETYWKQYMILVRNAEEVAVFARMIESRLIDWGLTRYTFLIGLTRVINGALAAVALSFIPIGKAAQVAQKAAKVALAETRVEWLCRTISFIGSMTSVVDEYKKLLDTTFPEFDSLDPWLQPSFA
ncbi:MAG: hypothetical protein LBE83_01485 [Propionibacteriaceae bacterium]|nr:hypothetical protein [Propionibacteriaceae bacterium]